MINYYYHVILKKENYSKFYIGVSDEGIISGIPVEFTKIKYAKVDLECKLNKYYNEFISLHKKKGNEEINIGLDTYYNFNKIISILKKHTKIKIHILNNINVNNKKANILLNYIDKK